MTPATRFDAPSNSLSRTVKIAAAVLVGFGLVAPGLTTTSAAETDSSEELIASVTRDGHHVAIVAGGCFWGMEHLLRDLDGVVDTEVGYAMPAKGDRAGRAEAVRVVFDPTELSYDEILRFYWRIHDPTTLNRQGNDRGAEYRSAVFAVSEQQRRTAERVRDEVDASGFWTSPLVTTISETASFTVASEHHQDFLVNNPNGYTCHFIRGEQHQTGVDRTE